MKTIKGFSLTQPWATLVATGAKMIETRSWSTDYRGWLAIHASKTFPRDCRLLCDDEPFRSALQSAGFGVAPQQVKIRTVDGMARLAHIDDTLLPRGAIVAIAILHHVGRIGRRRDDTIFISGKDWTPSAGEVALGNYEPGRHAWVFGRSLYLLPRPVPCQGKLGVWDIPPAVLAAVREQLVAISADVAKMVVR